MEEKLEKKLRGVGDGFAEIPDEALVDASGGQTIWRPPMYDGHTARPLWKCCWCGHIIGYLSSGSGLVPPPYRCSCGSTYYEYYGVDRAPQ